MLIPTAGLLHLRQALTSATVSLSPARAAATAARCACAGRVHAVSELTDALCERVHGALVYVCCLAVQGAAEAAEKGHF